jgi:hypothetical protein
MKQTMKLKTRDTHSRCTEGSVSSNEGTTKEFEMFRCTMVISRTTIYESGDVKKSGKQGGEILLCNPDSYRYHPIRKI